MAIFDNFDQNTVNSIAAALGNYAQFSTQQQQQQLANQRYEQEQAFRREQFDAQRSDIELQQRLAEEQRQREQTQLLAGLATEAEGITRTANLMDALAASGEISPTQVQALKTLPPEERGMVLMELTGALKPMTKPKPVVVGDALVDPSTGQPIYQAPAKPGETFTQVKGADIGLAGPDAEKLFNRSDKTGKITAAGGGGTTINVGEKAPSGYRFGADGVTLEPIKGGPKDPDVLANKTEAELKSLGFADRAKAADGILTDLGLPSTGETLQSVAAETLATPVGLFSDTGEAAVESAIRSNAGQSRDQAQRDFVTAVLRKESGAVISESEFATEARKFFPQPGDSEETVRQKAAARQRAIANLTREGGIEPENAESKPKTTRLKFNPATGGFD